MIKNNKLKTLISSIIILLPVAAVFIAEKIAKPVIPGSLLFCKIVPPIMLLMHLFLLAVVSFDKQSRSLNNKITNITFFIMPALSVFLTMFSMAISYGYEFSMTVAMGIPFAILFIVMGNYLPKTSQNRTFGIKTRHTLANEENWNATHRFCSKIWVACGFVILPLALLPEKAFLIAFAVVLFLMFATSMLYPYLYYRKQLASGEVEKYDYTPAKLSKKAAIITTVLTTVLVAFVLVIFFVGKLTFIFEQESLKIGTTFGGGTEINYADIEAVELREGGVGGVRYGGFGSSRLLFGVFKNDEFGLYTRYTYTKSESAIVIYSKGEEIVIADLDADSTREIYNRLLTEITK